MREMKIDKKRTSCPGVWPVLKASLGIHMTGAVWNLLHDCDETYNYWEPLHFLLHGHGCQTWEYSPEYGLRSYLYLWLVGWPARLFQLLGYDKRCQFYAVRGFMAVVAALSQTYLYHVHLHKLRKGVRGLFTWLFLLLSAGSFVSSTSFLPSSSALHLSTIMLAAWMEGRDWLAILAVAASGLVAWPFAALLGAPLALDLLVRRRRVGYFLVTSLLCGAVLCGLLLAVDSHYYGKWILAPYNILHYNVLRTSDVGGSHLYGVEDWRYYTKNYLLNWNIGAPLALLGLGKALARWGFPEKEKSSAVTTKRVKTPLWLLMLPWVLWNAVFFAQPHKEERFLYPIYPFMGLAAAVGFLFLFKLLTSCFRHVTRHAVTLSQLASGGVFVLFVALSVLRVVALLLAYGGALRIYSAIHELPAKEKLASRSLCIADEWHRFPSHFHLPQNWRLRFLESSFKGQLPAFYEENSGLNATRVVPAHFNSMNREVRSRYVSPNQCDYLIHKSASFLYTWRAVEWDTLNSTWFLEVDQSPTWSRTFFIPGVFWTRNRFNGYVLYQRQ